MVMLQLEKGEEYQVGKYRITVYKTPDGRIVGALIEGPRLPRPVYVAKSEPVPNKLPKTVRKFLRKLGFNA